MGKFSSKILVSVVLLALLTLWATVQNILHFTKKTIEAQRAWAVFSNAYKVRLLLRWFDPSWFNSKPFALSRVDIISKTMLWKAQKKKKKKKKKKEEKKTLKK